MTQAIVPKELLTATNGGLSLLVVSGGADGHVLTQQSDGTYAPEAPSTASGDVVGPSSATDNAIARFDTTSGKLLQNSLASITDTGVFTTTAANGAVCEVDPVNWRFRLSFSGLSRLDLDEYSIRIVDSAMLLWSNAGNNANTTKLLGLAKNETTNALEINSGTRGTFRDLNCRSVTLTGGNNLAAITKAALLLLTPTAASAGRWRVTDATPANREAYPDGTNWRYTSDDSVVT